MGNAAPPAVEPITVGDDRIKALTGLSPKTLKRAADRGEPVGRFHVGGRVLYDLATLKAWVRAQADAALAAPVPTTT